MRKYSKNGILYMETTPQLWASDTIRTLKLQPDIETIYCSKEDVSAEKIEELFYYRDKHISFSIKTIKGDIQLSGTFFSGEILEMREMRNILDALFIPSERMDIFLKTRNISEQREMCHLINIGTMQDIKIIDRK